MAMLFMKDFTVLTKLAGVGVIAVYSYLIFIFYAFFSNTDNMVAGGREGYQSMKYFSLDILLEQEEVDLQEDTQDDDLCLWLFDR